MFGMSYFAVADPQTTLSSGNTLAILALIIVTLAGVILYLARKLDVAQRDAAAEIKALNVLLLTEMKAHATDYKQMAEKDQEVMQLTSQTNTLLATKIEAVKGRH